LLFRGVVVSAQPSAQPDRPQAALVGSLRATRSGGRLALR
jgi:hypothetical protein